MENPEEKAKEAVKTACSLVAGENYGRAFAHFLLALTLDPSLKDEESLEDMFVDCLKSWAAQLVSMERGQDAVWCYEQACDVWTQSAKVVHATGQFLFNFGYYMEGTSFLRRAVGMEPRFPDWQWDLQNASSSLVERWHFRMLNDRRRNQCYFEALKKAVKCGHQKILDIGSGTGLLSMLAVKAGAERVTAVELDEVMCNLSRDIIDQNKMKKHIDVMKMKSTEMQSLANMDRYTLVVTETADAGLLGEGIIPTLQHAWKHLLKRNDSGMEKSDSTESPMSKVIPSGATVYIQLIQSDFIRRQHRVYRKEVLPFLDKTEIVSKSVCMNLDPSFATNEETEPYSSENLACIPGVWQPLTAPHQVYRFDFNYPEILSSSHLSETIMELPVTSPGRPDAIISWFNLHLDDDITISSSPEAGTCWEQAVYPIHPSHMDPGENRNNTNDSVKLDESVKISCRCFPTCMSFQLKGVTRKPQTISDAVGPTEDTRNLFKDNSHILRLSSKDIATLNDKKYCSWLENSVRESLTTKLKGRRGECQEIAADWNDDELNVNQNSVNVVSETISCVSCESQSDGSESKEVIVRHQESEHETKGERNPSKKVSSKFCSANEDSDNIQGLFEEDHCQGHGSGQEKCESRNLEENACHMMETLNKDWESRVTILDLTEINLSYFTCSSLDLPKMEAIGLKTQVDGETLLDKIVNCNKRTKERFRNFSFESVEDESLNQVKLIISDLVESGGVLRKNALEDVYYAGLKNSSQSEVKVIPEVLTVYAICVESAELSNNARICGSDPTLGIAVDLMNTFKTSTQMYVCSSKMPHKDLTDKFQVLTLDLARLVKNENPVEIFTQSVELILEAKDTGRLSAIVYWFEMGCGKSILSTIDEETHWMQAAFILDEDILIQCGEKIQLKAYFRNNSVSFSMTP